MVFGSGMDKQEDGGEYVSTSSSILSLQPWIFRKNGYQVDRENASMNGELSGKDVSKALLSPRNVRVGCGFGRRKSSIRSRRTRYSVMAVGTRNCLVPQLYGDDFEIEEFAFSPVPQSSSTTRSFCVTDGSHVISKSNLMGLETFRKNEIRRNNVVDSKDTTAGFSPLPESRKTKRKIPHICREREDISNQRQSLGGLLGTFNGLLLFCMGLIIGSAVTMMSRKREVDKLSDMLKQSENLVRDLQEEMELKDSVTVKELISNFSERQMHANTCDNLQGCSNLRHVDNANLCSISEGENVIDLSSSGKVVEQSESFRQIEAELEAELERLELNVSRHSLEGKIPVLDELDEDSTTYVAQGDLCMDKLAHTYNDEDESHCFSRRSSASRTPPPYYAVSPTELSLRLHELKQFRLEERIKELETALDESRKHLHFVDMEMMDSQNTSSMGFSSNQESPTAPMQVTSMDEPLCINFTGDTLDAYNEAFDEFMRMSEVEDKSTSSAPTSIEISRDDTKGGLQCASEGYVLNSLASDAHPQENKAMPKTICDSDGEFVRTIEVENGEVDYDIEDEEGRSLIQQIVERTRKGSSPFVLNVQKMLLSMSR